MKVKVEVLLEYDMNDTAFEAVEWQLIWALQHLYDCGLFSGDLNAVVEEPQITVTEMKE